MSHLGRKYQDQDNENQRIMHSTPKYGRDSYDSGITSFAPGKLNRSADNERFTITEQVSRKENVTVKSGVSRTVTQNVANSNVPSKRGLDFTSQEVRNVKEIGGARSSADFNSRRANGNALLGGDHDHRDSSNAVLMENSRSRYNSGITRGSDSGETYNDKHTPGSKKNELGFQYEDIQSFRERQQVEGDRLLTHRRSLSGDIVGTTKKGALGGDYAKPDSGYSSGIATDMENLRDDDTRLYLSSVQEYKSHGARRRNSQDDKFSTERILTDDKNRPIGEGSYVHPSITNYDYKLSSDPGFSLDDHLSKDKIMADAKSSAIGDGSHLHSSITIQDYRSSSDRGGSRGDHLSRDKILGDAKSSAIGGGSHLHSSTKTSDYKLSSDHGVGDRISRDRLLADAKSKVEGSDTNIRSSSNHDYKLAGKHEFSRSDDRNRLSGNLNRSSKDVTTQLHSRSSDHEVSSTSDQSFPHGDERYSKTDALVAKYLNSSRYKGGSKHGIHSDLDFEQRHFSSLTEIKEEGKLDNRQTNEKHKDNDIIEEKHHSVSGKPMSYLSKDSSYQDLLRKKKEDSPKMTGEPNVIDKKYEFSSSSKFTYGDIATNTDRGSDYEDSRNVPVSTGRTEGKDDLSRRLSYDWQDDSKARKLAIDRLLKSTRRYSADSILDKPSHDKKLDDVIGALNNRDLGSSTSHVEIRETTTDEKPEINRHKFGDHTSLKSDVYHHILSNKKSSELERDESVTNRGAHPRPGLQNSEISRQNITAEERVRKYDYKDTSQYETPYTSLDHSHYKPTPFGKNVDDNRIYAVPIKPSRHAQDKPNSSHPDIDVKGNSEKPGQSRPDYPPAYQPNSTKMSDGDPTEGIYDKLRRGSGPMDKPIPETLNSGINFSKDANRWGSIEGLDEPVYEKLYLSSDHETHGTKRRDSPIPMSDHFGLPLDKYNKPVALHGKTKEAANPDKREKGRDTVSKYPEHGLIDRVRSGDLSDITTEQLGNVTETTRTSYMQRSFMSRNGEVIKDEVTRHDEVRHDGQNAIKAIEGKPSNPGMHTRVQRYPAAKREDFGRDDVKKAFDSKRIEEVRKVVDTKETKETTEGTRKPKDTPDNHKLDEIMKLTGLDNTGDVTNYQEKTRRDDVTRIQDDSNIRTKVHRTDVNTSVNIVKEIPAPKKEKSSKSGIANLRSKIEALTKSVDELMDYRRKTLLRSYVKEHAERRSSKDIEELPKIERYEVKSKRYEPKDIQLDEVDYVHKEIDLEEMPRRPEHTNVDLNIKTLWLSEEQQTGKDIGLHIPKQINLAPENRTIEWWNAPTAEAADRFLCIGDWQWWNANTTEGVDHILGIQAINKETGTTGAIIAKYQGEEKPIEWAWLEASNQPSAAEKRRTLTRVLSIDREDKASDWWDASTAESADHHLSIGNWQWWNSKKTEGVDNMLGVRGSHKETGTILATYDEGTKPTAWTWVETPRKVPEIRVEKSHTITRSSRDIYVDETDKENVELLIRIKDEEAQNPYRFVAIRPGPVEKAIIVRQAVESEMPYNKNLLKVEGKGGAGLQVKNGVVQMRMQDMTPEARQAWVQIMGIEKRQMELQDNKTVEIPVQVIDKPRPEVIYAVPMKKKKKTTDSNRSKDEKLDEKRKLQETKNTATDKKKKEKQIKETESEKKKKELKLKKMEAEKKKKEDKLKLEKKHIQIKTKDTESQKKKKESEKLKEKEMERKRKEQKKKKEVSSVKKEKAVEKVVPPPVDRTTKPKPTVATNTETQEIRRHSDVVDAGLGQRSEHFRRDSNKRMSHVEVSTKQYGAKPSTVTKVQGGSFSPKTSGPFAMAGRGVNSKPQSARARMTTHTQNQNVKKEFEGRGNLTRKQSPSLKVVKRVSITQSGKTRPYTPDQTDAAIKHKSGSLQRRSGSHIAVPLRGGAVKQTNDSVKVISDQPLQSQIPPNQQMRETTVQQSHYYKTETHVTDQGTADQFQALAIPPVPMGSLSGHPLAIQGQWQQEAGKIGGGHVGPGHVEAGHVGAGHVGAGQFGAGHVGPVGIGQVGAGQSGSVMLQNMPTESSTDYSYETGQHRLPDGSVVQRDVIKSKRTSWTIEETPSNYKGQTKC